MDRRYSAVCSKIIVGCENNAKVQLLSIFYTMNILVPFIIIDASLQIIICMSKIETEGAKEQNDIIYNGVLYSVIIVLASFPILFWVYHLIVNIRNAFVIFFYLILLTIVSFVTLYFLNTKRIEEINRTNDELEAAKFNFFFSIMLGTITFVFDLLGLIGLYCRNLMFFLAILVLMVIGIALCIIKGFFMLAFWLTYFLTTISIFTYSMTKKNDHIPNEGQIDDL